LNSELKTPVSGISVVVVTAPDRDATADHLKNIYASVDSM
jgi:hypothetical protein